MGVDLTWRSVAFEKFSDQTVAQSSLRGKIILWTKLSRLSIARKTFIGHMKQLQLSRSEITTEAELILCRAGKTFFLFISDVSLINYKRDHNKTNIILFSSKGIFKCSKESFSTYKICAQHTGTVWESVDEGKESAASYHKSYRITKKTHPLLTEQSTRNTRV